jgi:hypothetical protein
MSGDVHNQYEGQGHKGEDYQPEYVTNLEQVDR